MDATILDSPYRNNAFRLAGLRIDTGAGPIREMVTELGAGGRRSRRLVHPTVLPVTPRPQPADVSAVLESLANPIDRLINELFWFWPTDYVDPATDGIDCANRQWLEQLPTDPIAAHNLAVLRHIEALETPRGEQPETWLDALTAWDIAIGAEETWQWLGEHAARIGRSRYRKDSPELALIRERLPAAVLRIHTNAIAHAILTGEKSAAERQFEVLDEFRAQIVMHPSVFDFADIDFARDQLARQLEWHRRRRDTQVLCTADTKPEEVLQEVRNLLVEEGRAQKWVRTTAMEDSVRARPVDSQASTTAIHCVVAYFNATKDWDGAREVLAAARPFATETSQVQRLDWTIEVLERQWREYVCPFCRVRRGVVGAEYSEFMHRRRRGYHEHGGREVDPELTTVLVPRCKRCRATHRLLGSAEAMGALMVLGGLLSGFTGLFLIGHWPTLVTGVALFFGGLAVYSMADSIGKWDRAQDDPQVQKLRRSGWT